MLSIDGQGVSADPSLESRVGKRAFKNKTVQVTVFSNNSQFAYHRPQANPCTINASDITSNDVNNRAFRWRELFMRTTLNIDDQLLAEAQRITGVSEKVALVREGLRALIERESARRLARLGGSEPQLKPIPRRQSDSAT